ARWSAPPSWSPCSRAWPRWWWTRRWWITRCGSSPPHASGRASPWAQARAAALPWCVRRARRRCWMAATSPLRTTSARSRCRHCAIASPWPRSCRSTGSRRTTCCARCWPGWRRRASERRPRPNVRHGGWMRPGIALLVLLGTCAVAGVAVLAGWLPPRAWWALVATIAAVSFVDVLRLRALPTPALERRLPEALPLGVSRQVELELRNTRAMHVELADLHPEGWQAEGLPVRLQLPADGVARVRYRIVPVARGSFVFEGAHL